MTHGLTEDASKKLQGTVWIDEADGQVAHLEAPFVDNCHVAGGFLADVQKGSNCHFDLEQINGGAFENMTHGAWSREMPAACVYGRHIPSTGPGSASNIDSDFRQIPDL